MELIKEDINYCTNKFCTATATIWYHFPTNEYLYLEKDQLQKSNYRFYKRAECLC